MKIDNKLDSISRILSKLSNRKSSGTDHFSTKIEQEESINEVLASKFSKTNLNELSDKELCRQLVTVLLLEKLGADCVSEGMISNVTKKFYEIIDTHSSFLELRKILQGL